MTHPSDSYEQRSVEPYLVDHASESLGIVLKPSTWTLTGGGQIEVDGMSKDPLVFCFAYAHLGHVKAGQENKLRSDVLRLWTLQHDTAQSARLIMVVAGEECKKHLTSGTWLAESVTQAGIEVVLAVLPSREDTHVRAAQKRQRMRNV